MTPVAMALSQKGRAGEIQLAWMRRAVPTALNNIVMMSFLIPISDTL
jgi:hypothetical protein